MMGGIYGFEGFVDSYYDTMGKAEELYEYFIEEAVKLYHEINRLDNVIPKPFFAIGTLEGVWTDITNESFGLELIDFFKRRMVDSYNFAYDGVVMDIWDLTMIEQTKDTVKEIFDELCKGNFRTWYESTIKNKQSLGRILELAEIRNNLQRLLD